ncbi:hypothetical protein [Eubacterium sp. MSJ-33]|uniref:hypothetical protein n=1 Tax=Eubacterium sp. MSJ-33 TaxID=2841528 RepID=UPI001C75B680|nr:hypothetical protein [Eubacterium sp. MSJ-33]QWT53816.1 hypothetical protein KP625_04150 [Eubacterium sp. MSJ-33]
METNVKKEPNKKGAGCLTLIILFAIIVIVAVSCGKKKSNNGDSQHIYDNAQVRDVINGSGNAKIGEYSIVKASSSEITDDVLNDWYFNYVKKNNYNYCMIVYTDMDGVGVYSSSGMVVKDAGLDIDSNGVYTYTSRSGETTYWEKNNTLELDKHE